VCTWFGLASWSWDGASLQAARDTLQQCQRDSLEGLIVHQDQGSPYTSGDSVTAVLESQAYASYSRPATPDDNPVNEAFFSRRSAEWGELLAEAKTFEDMYQLVSQAIAYYNTQRYLTSIGCQTPTQFTRSSFDHLTLGSPLAVSQMGIGTPRPSYKVKFGCSFGYPTMFNASAFPSIL
jgi:transposase InsO family protein